MTVLDSTLATSLGSVRARKQLSYLKGYQICKFNQITCLKQSRYNTFPITIFLLTL